MMVDNKELIERIMDEIGDLSSVKIEDIPNIELYMDQLTTFMDKHLSGTSRNPGQDKILTKTMINNYAKNDLLPPPIRKKYSKDHVILLIFIYYFKSLLTINDVQTLLEPLKERFHVSDTEGMTLSEIYTDIFEMGSAEFGPLKEDILRKYRMASEKFKDAKEPVKNEMEVFSFLAMLSLDVYIKKLIIEKVIDEIKGNI
ncbi:DUF1836 domain-containing protein [Butyrivibrio sp. MC2013]|uniref:DUF1836 domain-containing protein n=1 Tax=Butyrivibrio sp. MC2013 TaxID=1280686 RepID=UPI00040FD232|nr:DUF1836 domain-containing protein [Butyrivibrio sp. MC2013]